ncbi:MAG: Pirin domain protein [Bacteroidetes bacterium]|jgi:redox-sensitive bicupin YhaK (pirin superfamily)|nr:Pirin domain protein [Bacteroidota bacterium]
MKKSIEQIISAPAPHMVGDGFRVHNFFPGNHDIRRMSPFFLVDYGSKIEFNPSEHQRGVGVHPHRGFETVTLAYHGKVAHHDSGGNSGVIEEGGVQWMTAGSGVLHKEYHEKEFSKKGGTFQMAQLWVNLPAKYKMTKPKYQGFTQQELSKYEVPGNGGVIEVVAGEFNGVKGPASTFSPVNLFNARLNKGARLNMELPENFNTSIIVIEGTATVNGKTAKTDELLLFKNDGTEIEIEANENAVLLVMSGEPINEPIVPYGPFLMNSKEEIMQAYDDFHKGKFGVLED